MKTLQLTLLAVAGLTLLGQEEAAGNPVGGTIRSGSATISQGGGTLTIVQSTPRLSLDWRDFSIAAGEVTRFVQPNSRSIALNRVTSGNPSLLYGTLQANGRVFLLNPNGILVGPNGVINTRSFLGSTLDAPDERFFKGGKLTLSGDSPAPIRNEGTISALGGSVYLVAHTVENAGSIHAPQGQVGLAAGSEVIVHDTKGIVGVVAGKTTDPQAEVGVNNTGLIEAASAQLQAAGGNVYALAINNGGIIRANSVVRENGRVLLKATGGNIVNSGTISAQTAGGRGGSVVIDAGHHDAASATAVNSGSIDARGDGVSGRGGRVQITGDQVQLASGSSIDVSGRSGGGTVLIGGGAQGKNPAVQNALTTFMADGATIRADALERGHGGKVILWADDSTVVHGSISARGGLQGGNGGFVETSGKVALDVSRSDISAAAAQGRAGHWLLDPTDYVIDAPQAASIQSSLEGGTSVEIATASVGAQLGDLTIAAPISKGSGSFATLTLTAHHDIDLQRSITLFNGGLTLNAGNDIRGAGALDVDGDIHINAGRDITATLAGGGFYGPLFLLGRNVTISSDGPTQLGRSTISGNLEVRSQGDISQSGPLRVSRDSRFEITDLTDPHSITLGEANVLQGKVSFVGNRVLDLTLRNATAPGAGSELDLGASPFRDVSLTFDTGDLTVSSITALGTLKLTATGGALNQAALSVLTAQILEAHAAANLTLGGNNSIAHLADISGGNVTLRVADHIDQIVGTSLTVGNSFRLDAGAGRIKLDQENHIAGTVTLNTTATDSGGPAAVIRNAENLTLGQVSVANGTLDVRVTGDVVQSAGAAVKARNLTAAVTGNLLLENKENEFATLGNITVTKKFSLYDSSSIVGAGGKTRGLEVMDRIVGMDGITIRTRGDLVIGTGARLDARGGAPRSDVILSAEVFTGGSGDFHYLPTTKIIDTDGRYIIYSTAAKNNLPVVDPTSTQLEYGLKGSGLTADHTRDQGSFESAPFGGIPRTGNVFVFADPQVFQAPDEGSKFVADVLKIKPIAPVTFSLDVSRLPVPELGNIYTSSYHIYKEEEEAKKKKGTDQKAEVRELGLRPLALNWEPAH